MQLELFKIFKPANRVHCPCAFCYLVWTQNDVWFWKCSYCLVVCCVLGILRLYQNSFDRGILWHIQTKSPHSYPIWVGRPREVWKNVRRAARTTEQERWCARRVTWCSSPTIKERRRLKFAVCSRPLRLVYVKRTFTINCDVFLKCLNVSDFLLYIVRKHRFQRKRVCSLSWRKRKENQWTRYRNLSSQFMWTFVW